MNTIKLYYGQDAQKMREGLSSACACAWDYVMGHYIRHGYKTFRICKAAMGKALGLHRNYLSAVVAALEGNGAFAVSAKDGGQYAEVEIADAWIAAHPCRAKDGTVAELPSWFLRVHSRARSGFDVERRLLLYTYLAYAGIVRRTDPRYNLQRLAGELGTTPTAVERILKRYGVEFDVRPNLDGSNCLCIHAFPVAETDIDLGYCPPRYGVDVPAAPMPAQTPRKRPAEARQATPTPVDVETPANVAEGATGAESATASGAESATGNGWEILPWTQIVNGAEVRYFPSCERNAQKIENYARLALMQIRTEASPNTRQALFDSLRAYVARMAGCADNAAAAFLARIGGDYTFAVNGHEYQYTKVEEGVYTRREADGGFVLWDNGTPCGTGSGYRFKTPEMAAKVYKMRGDMKHASNVRELRITRR